MEFKNEKKNAKKYCNNNRCLPIYPYFFLLWLVPLIMSRYGMIHLLYVLSLCQFLV